MSPPTEGAPLAYCRDPELAGLVAGLVPGCEFPTDVDRDQWSTAPVVIVEAELLAGFALTLPARTLPTLLVRRDDDRTPLSLRRWADEARLRVDGTVAIPKAGGYLARRVARLLATSEDD